MLTEQVCTFKAAMSTEQVYKFLENEHLLVTIVLKPNNCNERQAKKKEAFILMMIRGVHCGREPELDAHIFISCSLARQIWF